MVKADAYGHGVQGLVPRVTGFVDCFGVASCDEGVELCKLGITKPILITSEFDNAKSIVMHSFTPFVFSKEHINQLQQEAKKYNKIIKVHLKADCGMGRFGTQKPLQSSELATYIKSMPNLKLTGIASHYSICEKENIAMHNIHFREHIFAVERLAGRLLRHSAATATALCTKGMYDMVRVGIGAYGYGEKMTPAMTIESRIIAVKKMYKGDIIGYNRVYLNKDMQIAVVSGGYADGIMRGYVGNYVTIRGKRHKIISVCMDSFVCALDCPCEVGDKVIILENKDANAFANHNKTICYEVLTSFKGRIKRIYV